MLCIMARTCSNHFANSNCSQRQPLVPNVFFILWNSKLKNPCYPLEDLKSSQQQMILSDKLKNDRLFSESLTL